MGLFVFFRSLRFLIHGSGGHKIPNLGVLVITKNERDEKKIKKNEKKC